MALNVPGQGALRQAKPAFSIPRLTCSTGLHVLLKLPKHMWNFTTNIQVPSRPQVLVFSLGTGVEKTVLTHPESGHDLQAPGSGKLG